MNDLGLEILGFGVSVFGLGFALWGFQVKQGTAAINRMSESLKEIVNIRLKSIDERSREAVDTLKVIDVDLRRLERTSETRLALLEQRFETFRSKHKGE